MHVVALLRGINVGGTKPIEMAALKQVFEGLDLKGVRTYIASGNVVFEIAESDLGTLTQRLEAAISARFGFEVAVLLWTSQRFSLLLQAIPATWVNDSVMKTDVMFLWPEVDSAQSLAALRARPDIEDTLYLPGALVWRIDREHRNKSRVPRIIGTPLYRNMTIRNINTVRALKKMVDEAGAPPLTLPAAPPLPPPSHRPQPARRKVLRPAGPNPEGQN